MRHDEKDYRELLADMVRRLREKHLGISRREFGEQLGDWLGRPAINPAQIGKYERGNQGMPADLLLAMRDMTGRSLDSLLDEVDETTLRAQVARLENLVEELMRRRGDGAGRGASSK